MTKEQIKSIYSVEEILRRYGVEVKRGRCNCFKRQHSQKGSMSVRYDSCNCFACNESYDVFSIVQYFENCDFVHAFEILGGDKPPSFSAMRKSKQRIKEKQIRKRKSELYMKELEEYCRLDRNRIIHAPKSHDEELNLLFVEAIKKLDYQDYILSKMEG